jgi:hypothetical protein
MEGSSGPLLSSPVGAHQYKPALLKEKCPLSLFFFYIKPNISFHPLSKNILSQKDQRLNKKEGSMMKDNDLKQFL